MTNPLLTHWTTIKRIPRYLKGIISYGLHFQPADKDKFILIIAMCDAD